MSQCVRVRVPCAEGTSYRHRQRHLVQTQTHRHTRHRHRHRHRHDTDTDTDTEADPDRKTNKGGRKTDKGQGRHGRVLDPRATFGTISRTVPGFGRSEEDWG
jgi:Ni/Co efflux regulator RcnB